MRVHNLLQVVRRIHVPLSCTLDHLYVRARQFRRVRLAFCKSNHLCLQFVTDGLLLIDCLVRLRRAPVLELVTIRLQSPCNQRECPCFE
jgi:hypothetical protein